MGAQPMYTVEHQCHRRQQHARAVGIRTVATKLIGKAPIAPDGVPPVLGQRRALCHPRRGFAPDLFLPLRLRRRVAADRALLKNMGST